MNIETSLPYELVVIVLLTSFAIFYFSFKDVISLHGIPLIILFRLLILLFLIILIFNPTFEYKGSKKISMPWHVYIDKSLSIKYHKQPSSISYKTGIQKFLNQIKKNGVSLKTSSFGSVLDTIKDISNLELNSNSTNLGLVFDKIKNDYQKNIAGIIIFTDGQINQGAPIQQFYVNNDNLPVHIIGIGDTIPNQDVLIKSIDIPPLCIKGENVNINVLISSLGIVNERVNITLFDERNKLIGSKLISIAGDQASEMVRFQISPNKIGKNNFLVKCSALSDEINIQNNQQKITLHVMKDEYNIALVTGAPSFNTKVLKNFLKEKDNIKVDNYVINSENFNREIKKFLEKKYEVIIFDNNPVPSSAKKWNSITRVFAKKLLSHNSSFFIMPGPEIDINSLNRYLKIIDLEAMPNSDDIQYNKKWKFLSSWNTLSSINRNGSFSIDFNSYPPQNPAFQLLNTFDDKKAQNYANYIEVKKVNPLLILGEKQLVRYAVWNSTDLYSLKLFNSEIDLLFENSIQKIINWLMKKSHNSEFIFRTDKNSYQHGESIFLTGVSSNIGDELKLKDGAVELYHNNEYIGSKPLFFDLNEDIYKANFWAPKPGLIDYIVKINNNSESYEVSRGEFKVQESHIELNRLFLNKNKLINLSKSSNGSYRHWHDKENLISSIKDIQRTESYIAVITFRYNYLYICFLIVLLYVEWFYRRKIGLN